MPIAPGESPESQRWLIDGLLLHPVTRSMHRCRVRVSPAGLVMTLLPGEPRHEVDERTALQESEPILVAWRSLRGFSADESLDVGGVRLQVLEIDGEDGVLTLLVEAVEVSVLLSAVGRWSGQWRLARSPLGLVIGGRRRRLARRVA